MAAMFRWRPAGELTIPTFCRNAWRSCLRSPPTSIFAAGSVSMGVLGQTAGADAVPVVFVLVPDPVGAGYVASLARPGGNTAGFMLFEYSISGKWLELLREIMPSVTRAAIVRDATITAGIGQWGALQAVAPSLGIEIFPVNVRDIGEMERAVAGLARASNVRPDRDRKLYSGGSPRVDHHDGSPSQAACDLLRSLLHHHRRPDLLRGQIWLTNFGARPAISIASSRARSPPTCRCRHRRSTSWSSTSRPRRRSASKCRRCCSRAPTR